MLYICRKSYLTIHVVAPAVLKRGPGLGVPEVSGVGGRGTSIPGRRGARHRRGAGLCGLRAEDQVWGGTGMLPSASGKAPWLLLGLGWVVPAPWGSVVGVSSPLITLLPTDFVSLFLTPLTFIQLEGSLRPTSSSQADTLLFLSLHVRGWRQRGMGGTPIFPLPSCKAGSPGPTDKGQLRFTFPCPPSARSLYFPEFQLKYAT